MAPPQPLWRECNGLGILRFSTVSDNDLTLTQKWIPPAPPPHPTHRGPPREGPLWGWRCGWVGGYPRISMTLRCAAPWRLGVDPCQVRGPRRPGLPFPLAPHMVSPVLSVDCLEVPALPSMVCFCPCRSARLLSDVCRKFFELNCVS